MQPQQVVEIDPFDLPEWLGEREVVWRAEAGLASGHRVTGRLTSGADELGCDLLAVDEAYPAPVIHDRSRLRAHQLWRHGEVLLGTYDDRLALAVPGTGFDADRVLETLRRLTKAVGGRPNRMAALLRCG